MCVVCRQREAAVGRYCRECLDRELANVCNEEFEAAAEILNRQS